MSEQRKLLIESVEVKMLELLKKEQTQGDVFTLKELAGILLILDSKA